MKFTGYIGSDRYLFVLTDIGHLIAINLNCPADISSYNDELYDPDDDSYTIRDMLIHDGVEDLLTLPTNPVSISIYNGADTVTPAEAVAALPWDTITVFMHSGLMQYISDYLDPATPEEFLQAYLELSPDNLIIG